MDNRKRPMTSPLELSSHCWRIIICAFALISFFEANAAENPQATAAFDQAMGSFKIEVFDRAEKEFGEFVAKYPDAPQVSEAILLQARARFQMKQYDGAVELLSGRLAQAGELSDRYHFAIAEAEMARQNFAAASKAFRTVLESFPDSPLRLQAAKGEALAEFEAQKLLKREDQNFTRTIELLKEKAGAFQQAASTSTNDSEVVLGHLLLAEAYFQQKNYRAAEETLKEVENRKLPPEIEWLKQHLMAISSFADNRPDTALQYASNCVVVARSGNMGVREASALRLQAEILNKTKPDEAIRAYQQIIQIKDIPVNQTRQAVLALAGLMVEQNRLTNAIAELHGFLAQNSTNRLPADVERSQAVGLDLIQLTLGELQLRQFYTLSASPTPTNAPSASVLTNLLLQARTQFDAVIAITNTPHAGKAHLNRGWSFWEETKLAGAPNRLSDAEADFRAAAEKLPLSESKATAVFKMAECQFQRRDFTNALQNFAAFLSNYADLPEIKSKLFDQALYDIVRANVELGNFEAAEAALSKLLNEFAAAAFADDALFYYGQSLLKRGRAQDARRFLVDFEKRFATSELLPKARLAIARSYVDELKWPEAIGAYDQWLKSYTNHSMRAEAAFHRAWTFHRANQDTNALPAFTNFVVTFPSSPLAPLAQFWVAEHFYRQGDYENAELNYGLVERYQAAPQLRYQSRLMAAKSALLRDKPSDAFGILTNLLSDPNCPASVRPEAFFVFGDVMLKQADTVMKQPGGIGTNKFTEAINVFTVITNQYPTSRVEPLARGKIANCYFQLAAITTNATFYAHARDEYSRVMNSPIADISTRSQAEVGLATVLEAESEFRSAEEQKPLLRQALGHYLNVLFGKGAQLEKGEQPDLFWMQKAGVAAGRLAERLQMFSQAVRIYERLGSEFPGLRPLVEKKLRELQDRNRS